MRASLSLLQFQRLYILPVISNFLGEFSEIDARLFENDRTIDLLYDQLNIRVSIRTALSESRNTPPPDHQA